MNDTLDPKLAWEPAPESAWDDRWAAHLYRRAAFGFPAIQSGRPSHVVLAEAVERGREACIEELLTGGERAGQLDELMDTLGESIASKRAQRFVGYDHERLQGWWLYRMVYTPHPLRERMTLFWHDHFATSVAKVGSPLMMFRQNQLLRTHALGRFGPLLEGISRDPAMMVWLDSQKNQKGRPNENFGREIMELFSLGVGNYTERDIQEVARCFTGWGNNGDEFFFNPDVHDDGEKTVLGNTGPFDGDDVVRILLKHPATPRYLVRKLYAEFVSEVGEPDDALLAPLVDGYIASDYDTTALLRRMLSSRHFFSEAAYRARVKSPVEYVVGLARSFDVKINPERLAGAMNGLGQTLFAPPNVAGWDGGRAWLNSATLLARHNFAARFVTGDDARRSANVPKFLADHAGRGEAAWTDFLVDILLQGDVTKDVRRELVNFARRNNDENGMRKLVHMILLVPEFQLA